MIALKLSLKTTILFSSAVAAALNVGQFFDTYQQREAAFAPAWAASSTVSSVTSAPPPAAATATKLTTVPASTPTPPPAPKPAPPSPDIAIANTLNAAGLSSNYSQLYLTVQEQTGTPWQLLAAVHHYETGQSGSTSRTSYAGAVGPMQFLPATFVHYSNGDITNVNDAMLAAGRYLADNGAANGDYTNALYHYNHSNSYVSRVLTLADQLGL